MCPSAALLHFRNTKFPAECRTSVPCAVSTVVHFWINVWEKCTKVFIINRNWQTALDNKVQDQRTRQRLLAWVVWTIARPMTRQWQWLWSCWWDSVLPMQHGSGHSADSPCTPRQGLNPRPRPRTQNLSPWTSQGQGQQHWKMVIKLLQQSTFRRYAAKVLSAVFNFCCFRCVIVPLTGVINYVAFITDRA